MSFRDFFLSKVYVLVFLKLKLLYLSAHLGNEIPFLNDLSYPQSVCIMGFFECVENLVL